MNREGFLKWLRGTFPRKPLVMGILNCTPDSFFDGGKHITVDAALRRVDAMISQGVDMIDIGGASSRPGAQDVGFQEELDRVMSVIDRMLELHDICLSIDTFHPEVMVAAVKKGVTWINDIKALQMPGALDSVAHLDVPICLMHMRGEPVYMQNTPEYSQGVVPAVQQFFASRIDACLSAGIKLENLMLDPGFGFGKSVNHNLLLMKHIEQFQQFKRPLVLGVSRKSTLGALLKNNFDDRLYAGLGLAAYAVLWGVSVIRTHDVLETRQVLDVIEAVHAAVDREERIE